jgi:predicted O-methyltransferase YrrM
MPIDPQASSKAKQVLKEIEGIANQEFLPIIGPKKGSMLSEEVRKVKPKNVLEVGTLIGYSAILICKELDADARFVSIEQHSDEAVIAQENLLRAGVSVKFDVIVGDALEVIPTLKCCFDFAFIDAEKDEYYQYLKLVENKLVKGAVVFADNAGIFANEMRDYLDYVRNSGKYKSRYISVGEDGVEISIKLT